MQQKRINRMFNLIRALVMISLIVNLGWTRSVCYSNSDGKQPMEIRLNGDEEAVLAGDEDTAITRSADTPMARIRWQPAFSVGRLSGVQF